ncbi:MAG: alpha/beta fold hydrolase [Acidimicrobiales bacterium]|nr:alpha/beta fold hydrolase [Acidimicrobiales bacterium]
MRTREQRLLNHVSRIGIYEEHLVPAGGAEIVLSVWRADGDGGSAGPPVVFLPGTMTHPLFYEEWCDALATSGFPVVGVHFRGHGKSPRGVAPTFDGLLDDARVAVGWAADRFGGPVVVMGSSQGGILAVALAATGDERVAAVVAHNVLDPTLPESFGVTRFPEWLAPVGPTLTVLLALVARVAPDVAVPVSAYLDADRVFHEEWSREQFESDPLGLRSYPLGLLAGLLTADLSGIGDGSIRCPVVVVAATGDALFTLDYTRSVFERIVAPVKELVELDLDCHLVFTEAVDEALDPVVGALRRALATGS